MPQATCCVPGCGRRAHALGMCKTHRHRVQRNGDPQAHIPIGYITGRVLTGRHADTGATGRPLYESRDWCHIAYFQRDLTLRKMADEAGCALRTIARWMTRHGLELPASTDKREQRGTLLRGEQSPNWRGGRRGVCPICGGVKDAYAKTCLPCRDTSGDKNAKWRGNDIGYEAAHFRVKAIWGTARDHTCRHCAGPAAHWAYDHGDPNEKLDPEQGPYSTDPAHYFPLCVRCHLAFDRGHAARRRAADRTRTCLGPTSTGPSSLTS
jgi:hypothetical protein